MVRSKNQKGAFVPIYNLFLEPHERWDFYVADDGSMRTTSNVEKPLICIPGAIWNASKKDFIYGQYRSYPNTISVATMGVPKKNLDEFLLPELNAIADASMTIYPNDRFVIFVGQKKLPHDLIDDLIEVGIFCSGQRGINSPYEHNKWEKEVNRHINRPSSMKAFW